MTITVRRFAAGAALLILGTSLATGFGTIGPRAIPAHAQRLADGKVMTIPISTAARVFDMSPTGSQPPPGWMAPSFDDSSWDHAVVLKKCRFLSVDGVHYNHDYWGVAPSDHYLI
jgi:hypothetical protein